MVALGTAEVDGIPSVTFHETLDELFEAIGRTISHVVIDMPIGLSSDGVRAADVAARANLGPRRSTFFPTPVRAVLNATTFDEANAASKAASGRGLSVQSWNLVPKIREIDGLFTTAHQTSVLEGHPESSFAAMAGSPVMSRKASPEGRAERTDLLRQYVTRDVAHILAAGTKRVDAIDALALLWTARRVRAGNALRLGDDTPDSVGRPMWLTI